jgi:hypothetical protein
MNTPGAKAYRPWTPELYARQTHSPAAKLPEDDLVFFLIDVVLKADDDDGPQLVADRFVNVRLITEGVRRGSFSRALTQFSSASQFDSGETR